MFHETCCFKKLGYIRKTDKEALFTILNYAQACKLVFLHSITKTLALFHVVAILHCLTYVQAW